MPKPQRQRFVALIAHLHQVRPDIDDPTACIAAGSVLVDGVVVTNPRAMVPRDAAIRVRWPARPRGAAKLAAALRAFEVDVRGRVAVDVGASAGGFTTVLLDAGAARVYAVDAGFGQLLGSLRRDPRVVVLERVNVSELSAELVPDVVDVITMDLSYLSIAAAAPQLENLHIATGADLVALVKPMFELGLGRPPTRAELSRAAVESASVALDSRGWRVRGRLRSPVRGSRGAVEFFVHARRVA